MSDQSLTDTIRAAMKAAMKARDKERLATIRLIQAEFKRIEVDERIEIDDARALAVLDKMVKQRRDSAQQYVDHVQKYHAAVARGSAKRYANVHVCGKHTQHIPAWREMQEVRGIQLSG